MLPYLEDFYGNPGSIHSLGNNSKKAIDRAREQVASFVGAASPDQIIFTSGGTEGNNLVIAGLKPSKVGGRKAIACSQIEHDSIHHAIDQLCANGKYNTIAYIKPENSGIITKDTVLNQLRDLRMFAIASVMTANNELGTINPVREICAVMHEYGVLFHTDAVQAAGIVKLDAAENEYDFVTISSHKLHGPKGMGALYARDKSLLEPLICGGSDQEFGLRGGTENVAGIVGFGKACELASLEFDSYMDRRKILAQKFLYFLKQEFAKINANKSFEINGSPPEDFKTVSIRFDGVDAETLVLYLSAYGICCSAGSACRSHESEPSRVLTAIGLTPEQARSSVRFSMSEMTTEEEIKMAAEIIAFCVTTLRGGSA